MDAILNNGSSGFGLDDLFGQAINYVEHYKSIRIAKKIEKKEKAKKIAEREFVDNLLHRPLTQKSFFDHINSFLLEIKSELLLSLNQRQALEFCEKIEGMILPIKDFPLDHTIPEFDTIEEFHAYSSGRAFIETIISLYEGIKYIAEHGEIDENSPAYNLFIESEIKKILKVSTKRKRIDSIENFLINL